MLRKALIGWVCWIVLVLPAIAGAAVDWELVNSLKLAAEPLDAVAASDGSNIFVLTQAGEIIVFDSNGRQSDVISVGKEVKALRIGPTNETLLLLAPDQRQVRVIELNFIQAINIAGDPVKGNPDAPLAVVVFTDFQCPYCARLVPVLEQVLGQYPNKVKVVFKNFPLRSHAFAVKAATAALAAGTMGKFWEFHDALFQNYNQLNDEKIDQIARDLGLDPDIIKERQKSPEVLQVLQQDVRDAMAAKVRSTPSVFINGRLVKRRDLNGFQTMIEAELKRLAEQNPAQN